MNAPQYVLLHIGREVDEDIAAEHDIEAPQDAVAVQQIELAKLDPIANARLDGPLPGLGFIEITVPALAGQAPGHGQAVITAGTGGIEHAGRDLTGNDLHPAAQTSGIGTLELVDGHAQRIGLL